MKKLIPAILSLAALTTYACGEDSPKEKIVTIDAGVGGGDAGVGGGDAGEGGSKVCIEDNLAPEVRGATKKHYFVSGKNISEVYDDIFHPLTGKGYKISNSGKRVAGTTSCDGDYDFEIKFETYLKIDNGQKPCCCNMWVDRIKSNYEPITTIPRWLGCNTYWDSFLEGLVEHEQGHVDVCLGYNLELEEELLGTKVAEKCGLNCDIAKIVAMHYLKNLLDAKQGLITQKYDSLNKDYDQETNHGATQGAVLNPNQE